MRVRRSDTAALKSALGNEVNRRELKNLKNGDEGLSSWITAEQSGTRLTVFSEKLMELDTELYETQKSARLDYFGDTAKHLSILFQVRNSPVCVTTHLKAGNKDFVSFSG